MKCKKHPTYQAKTKPRVACLPCWKIWNDKNDKRSNIKKAN